jgi:peptide chain release factor 2
LHQQKQNTTNCGGIFDLESRETEIEKLRQKSGVPDFWNDNSSAQAILKKISLIEKELALWSDLEKRHGDVEVLLEFAASGDAELEEVNEELKSYTQIIEEVELKMILGDEQDTQDAIVTIHPGAGGTESQDWAEMLYRMYTRWVEQKGFKKDVMDYQPGDEAGLKDVTFEVKGDYAYG